MSITQRYLTVTEVATLCSVSRSTAWLWVKEKRLESVRLPVKPGSKRGGAIRIPSSEVFRILEQKQPKALQGF